MAMLDTGVPNDTYGSVFPRTRRATNTGVSGFGLPGGTAAPPVETAPPAPTTPTPPQTPAPAAQTYRVQPVDTGKFTNTSYHDPKYDFLRIAQGYDPTRGVQQGMIDALNQLGYATWSGSGQRLGYSNVTDLGRQMGLNAGGFNGDFIQNWGNGQNPGAQWAWDWYDPQQAPELTPQAQMPGAPDPFAGFNPFQMFPYNNSGVSGYGPGGNPAPAPQQSSPISDPAFWQSIMGLMGPQPGYSAQGAPSFSGAQSGGGSNQASAGLNPQMLQLLSQLLASVTGSHA